VNVLTGQKSHEAGVSVYRLTTFLLTCLIFAWAESLTRPSGERSVRRRNGEHKLSIAHAIAHNTVAERYAGGIAGPGAATPACA